MSLKFPPDFKVQRSSQQLLDNRAQTTKEHYNNKDHLHKSEARTVDKLNFVSY